MMRTEKLLSSVHDTFNELITRLLQLFPYRLQPRVSCERTFASYRFTATTITSKRFRLSSVCLDDVWIPSYDNCISIQIFYSNVVPLLNHIVVFSPRFARWDPQPCSRVPPCILSVGTGSAEDSELIIRELLNRTLCVRSMYRTTFNRIRGFSSCGNIAVGPKCRRPRNLVSRV